MIHPRTTIAHALRAQLRGEVPAPLDKLVFLERVTPLTAREYPSIVITSGEDRTDEASFQTSFPREYTRFFTLTVDCSARDQAADIALDKANSVAAEAERAAFLDVTLGGVCKDLRLNASTPEVLDDAGTYVGVVALEFEAVYLFNEETDGDAVWFNRFGVKYDLAAAQAEADMAQDSVEIRAGSAGPE